MLEPAYVKASRASDHVTLRLTHNHHQDHSAPLHQLYQLEQTFKETAFGCCVTQVWGWVQEMYGFTIAAYLGGIKKVDLFLHMMAQPPWDTNLELGPNKPYYILHYTYGMDYKLTGA